MNDITSYIASYRLGSRRLVVCEPGVQAYGHTVVELVHGLALARREGADVVVVHNGSVVNPALFDIELDGCRILRRGALRALTLARHRMHQGRPSLDDFRDELAVELKRRTRESVLTKQSRSRVGRVRARLDRYANTRRGGASNYFRRRLMITPLGARLRPEAERVAREQAMRLGIAPEAPIVCLHVREAGFKRGREQEDKERKQALRMDHVRNASIESHFAACDLLVGEGYTVVRIGDPSMTPVSREGYLDLATSPARNGLLELYFMFRADLLVVGESGPNVLGYLTDTPILCVNATDPFSAYPARSDGHVLLKRVVDRKTNEPLRLSELLEDRYVDNLRDVTYFRFEENSSEEIAAAVREALAWTRGERTETERQAAFRELATQASLRQRDRVAYVRKWGPDAGFLGHGRVVDFQLAERW